MVSHSRIRLSSQPEFCVCLLSFGLAPAGLYPGIIVTQKLSVYLTCLILLRCEGAVIPLFQTSTQSGFQGQKNLVD